MRTENISRGPWEECVAIKCNHIAVSLPQFVRAVPERFMCRYKPKIGPDYQPVFKTPLLTGQKARRRLPVLPNGAHSRGGQGCPMVLPIRSVCLVLSAEKKPSVQLYKNNLGMKNTAKFIDFFVLNELICFGRSQKCAHQQVLLINPNWSVLLQY